MKAFTALYNAVSSTTATSEKVSLLSAYFRSASDGDAAHAVALIAGGRPKRTASTNALRELAKQHTGLPDWLISESHQHVGDLAETIALLINATPPASKPSTQDPPSLTDTIQRFVLPLQAASDDLKRNVITGAWAHLDADERFIYHKLIRGGFRMGVAKGLLARALAEVAEVDQAVMTHRLAGTFTPTPDNYRALLDPPDDLDRATAPYPFFLAHPLEAEPETLGHPDDWTVEWKYDGIRAQLIKRNGAVTLWSRGDELITHQFPEITASARSLPDGIVLDGEVLLFNESRPAPFSELQTRLNRAKPPAPQLSLFNTSAARFIAYDCIEHDAEDIRHQPFRARRDALLNLIADNVDTDAIAPSPTLDAPGWHQRNNLRSTAPVHGAEGLMLKRNDAPYGVGRTKAANSNAGGSAAWLKWKTDPCTVDAVMTAAQLGTGKRASLYTDYTFAVWSRDPTHSDDTAPPAELVNFAKAYSGLSNTEIEATDAWIRTHTTRRAGLVRIVEPSLVFEIAFEAVRVSTRHKSGLAVRFPRIKRRRTDKQPVQADTIDRLHALAKERAW